MDSANAAYYAQRESDFGRRLGEAQQRWKAQMAPYKGLKVVTYHRSWTNFAEAFGLDVVNYVEPKPGIPPTPQHTLNLINAMKAQNVKIILVEPYFDTKTPKLGGVEDGRESAVLSAVVGACPRRRTIQLFDTNVTN